MKLGQFKIIPRPKMSNLCPESDVVIAARLAKIQEKVYILDDELKRRTDLRTVPDDEPIEALFIHRWQCAQVRKQLIREMNVVLAKHDAEQEAYTEWIEAGRPDL